MLKWFYNLFTSSGNNVPYNLFWMMHGGMPTNSGISINEANAQYFTPVFACIKVISEEVGSIPFPVYKQFAKGKEKAYDHPNYRLLNHQPNSEIPAQILWETLTAHLALYGNAYCEIERNTFSEPINLWIIPPNKITPKRNTLGNLYYEVNGGQVLQPENILHFIGFGYDAYEHKGKSPIRMAREEIGLGVAAQNWGSSFFRNGARPSGVYTTPNKLKPEAIDNLRKQFMEQQGGSDNVGKPMFLQDGISWSPTSVPPEDAQFLITQKYNEKRICSIFRVPPPFIQDYETMKYATSEQAVMDFAKHTLRHYCIRFQQEVNRKLFTPAEQTIYFAKHDLDIIQMVDPSVRMEIYNKGWQMGVYCPNEIRNCFDMNSIDGGDKYQTPLNMGTLTPKTLSAIKLSALNSVQDSFNRMFRRECANLKRLTKKDAFNLIEFYNEHKPIFIESIIPSLSTYLKAHEIEADANIVATELSKLMTEQRIVYFNQSKPIHQLVEELEISNPLVDNLIGKIECTKK